MQVTRAAHIYKGQMTLDRKDQDEELFQKFSLAFANLAHFGEHTLKYLCYLHRS